jgi:hypothetical protein
MNKLKTLKDLMRDYNINPESRDDYDRMHDDLQDVAREWISVLLKYRHGLSDEQDDAEKKLGKELVKILDWDYYHLDVVCKVFMYFFNLNDGD